VARRGWSGQRDGRAKGAGGSPKTPKQKKKNQLKKLIR
jgi:hypothetical protein